MRQFNKPCITADCPVQRIRDHGIELFQLPDHIVLLRYRYQLQSSVHQLLIARSVDWAEYLGRHAFICERPRQT